MGKIIPPGIAALFFLILSAESLWAYQLVPTKVEFAVDIAYPTQMVTCLNRVWVYGHESKVLTLIHSESGKKLKEFSVQGLLGGLQLSALGCFEEKLLIASHSVRATKNSKGDGPSRLTWLELSGRIELDVIRSWALPFNGRLSDLKCSSSRCAALAEGKIYFSSDLNKWDRYEFPEPLQVLYRGSNKDLNPFDDWQSPLNLAKGIYSRIALPPFMKLALLDPFRSDVVLERNDGTREKWGGWGVWEGHMMSPRAFAYVDPGVFVIFDAGLKALFVFTPNGDYLGAVGSGDLIWTPEYVTAIHSHDDKLFVADFLKSRVTAFRFLRDPRNSHLAKSEKLTRSNLFRRDEVLATRNHYRCLVCHDGTVVDSLSRYVKTNANHPVHFQLQTTTRLFLEEGNEVSCATCHNPHHGARMEGGVEKPTSHTPQLSSPYLRDSFRGLCSDCHSEQGKTQSNHPDKKGDLCGKCHVIHGGAPKLLIKPQSQLCMECHQKQRIEHKTVENLLQTQRAEGLAFHEGQISCNTCHQVHKNQSGEKAILKSQAPLMEFCASCHGKKTELLFGEFHKRVSTKGGAK